MVGEVVDVGVSVGVTTSVEVGVAVNVAVGFLVGVTVTVTVEVGVRVVVGLGESGLLDPISQKMTTAAPTISNSAASMRMNGALFDLLCFFR